MGSANPEIWGVRTFVSEKTLRAQALKVLEEAAELVEAVKHFEFVTSTGEKAGYPEVVAWDRFLAEGELADVIQATLNLAAAIGMSQESVDTAMAECHRRNALRGRV